MRYRAFIIGSFTDGDVNVERFQTTVLKLNYDLDVQSEYRRALKKLAMQAERRSDDDRELVLFCIDPGLQAIHKNLLALRASNRQIVVYAHPRRASPQIAVEYCHAGLADDYLVWGEAVTADRIEEHVKALHQRKSPYPKIDVRLTPDNGHHARVFIATPYDRDNRMVMSDAVDHVLERVNLTPCWADALYRDSSVPEQVLSEIRSSALLIANISAGPNAIHNPNVYYEAGQATALGIPVIFVRPLEERDLIVPADISERRRIEYDNPIDLSMRLYRGLRDEKC
jgi:hypothetical protein